MKKVFISQPMEEKTLDKINEIKKQAIEYLEAKGYEIINKTITEELDESKRPELKTIGRNIYKMAECDAIYFTTGWSLSKNCRIERLTALLYGIEILNDEEK